MFAWLLQAVQARCSQRHPHSHAFREGQLCWSSTDFDLNYHALQHPYFKYKAPHCEEVKGKAKWIKMVSHKWRATAYITYITYIFAEEKLPFSNQTDSGSSLRHTQSQPHLHGYNYARLNYLEHWGLRFLQASLYHKEILKRLISLEIYQDPLLQTLVALLHRFIDLSITSSNSHDSTCVLYSNLHAIHAPVRPGQGFSRSKRPKSIKAAEGSKP